MSEKEPLKITPAMQRAMDQAKIGLMTKGSVFIITVTFSLRISWNDKINTARTDGRSIEFNPKFFMDLKPAQRIGLLAHEAWHVAFDHLTRRGDRDKTLWNYAGDYVINNMLLEAPGSHKMELPEGGLWDEKFSGWSTVQVYDYLKENSIEVPLPDSMLDLDEPQDPDELIEIETEIKQIMVKALTQSKLAQEKPGTVPGEIERAIDDLLNPILPWQDLLAAFMTECTKDDYTFRRPNKRYVPDFYLPTQYSDSLQHLTIAIDTSGSVTPDMLREILSEIVGIHEQFKPKKLTILDCDRKIHNVYEVNDTDNIMDLKFTGGGGTAFHPVFDYCEKHGANALLYFTDLYGTDIQKEPGFPVLWLCYSKHKPSNIGQTIYYDRNHG